MSKLYQIIPGRPKATPPPLFRIENPVFLVSQQPSIYTGSKEGLKALGQLLLDRKLCISLNCWEWKGEFWLKPELQVTTTIPQYLHTLKGLATKYQVTLHLKIHNCSLLLKMAEISLFFFVQLQIDYLQLRFLNNRGFMWNRQGRRVDRIDLFSR